MAKNGGNPRLLTDANGEVREEYRNAVSARELRKFHDIYRQHLSVPRAALYLADGSHLRHKYTKDMQVREMYSPSRRGVLTLYALPDTVEQGLTEAQAYNIVWDAFNENPAEVSDRDGILRSGHRLQVAEKPR